MLERTRPGVQAAKDDQFDRRPGFRKRVVSAEALGPATGTRLPSVRSSELGRLLKTFLLGGRSPAL